jgi:hypothetical protein
MNVPAGDLVGVVSMVLPDTSRFAVHAQLVANEILRLRDAGRLSESVAQEISHEIYQSWMRSQHVGDFELMEPIRLLGEEINRFPPGNPDIQIDPVQVNVGFAEIVAHIRKR